MQMGIRSLEWIGLVSLNSLAFAEFDTLYS